MFRGQFFWSIPIFILLGITVPLKAQFGETVQYFPHFAAGAGATTLFTIHNPANPASIATVDVELYRSDGTLFSTEQVVLPGGATQTVSFGGQTEPTTSGWARLSSRAAFTASELFKISDISNVGVSPSRSHTQLKLFAFVTEGTRTGFAMANPSETTASSITVRTSDTTGTVLGDVRVTLPPLQHTAVFLDEAPYLMQTDGSVTLTASEPVIALTLRLDDGTKLAGVPVVAPTQQGDGELAPDSVITETLVDGAVTGSKIADGAVGSRQLADRVDFGAEGSAGSVVIGNDSGRAVVVLDTLEDGGGAIVLGDADGNVTTLLSGGGTGVGNALLSIVDPITQIPLIDIQANNLADGTLVTRNAAGVNIIELNSTAGGSGFVSVYDSFGQQTAGIDGSSGFIFGLAKSFLVPDPTHTERMIKYTSVEGPEAAIYIRGTAELESGKATIEFPDHFSSMAVPSSITVTLTPRSSVSRGLAAVGVGADGIKVAELAEGSGNYPFDYVAHAVRKGYEDYQVYVAKDPKTGTASMLSPAVTNEPKAKLPESLQGRVGMMSP